MKDEGAFDKGSSAIKTLPSGRSDLVGDEDLARFLASSSQFNARVWSLPPCQKLDHGQGAAST